MALKKGVAMSEKFFNVAEALPHLIKGVDGEWYCRPLIVVGENKHFESVCYIEISEPNFNDGHKPNIIVLIDVPGGYKGCRNRTEVLTQYCTLGKELTEALDKSQVYEATHETVAYRKEAFKEEDWAKCILTLLSEE